MTKHLVAVLFLYLFGILGCTLLRIEVTPSSQPEDQAQPLAVDGKPCSCPAYPLKGNLTGELP